jgi:hypothetical protein
MKIGRERCGLVKSLRNFIHLLPPKSSPSSFLSSPPLLSFSSSLSAEVLSNHDSADQGNSAVEERMYEGLVREKCGHWWKWEWRGSV